MGVKITTELIEVRRQDGRRMGLLKDPSRMADFSVIGVEPSGTERLCCGTFLNMKQTYV